jgi:hypothetical protein
MVPYPEGPGIGVFAMRASRCGGMDFSEKKIHGRSFLNPEGGASIGHSHARWIMFRDSIRPDGNRGGLSGERSGKRSG